MFRYLFGSEGAYGTPPATFSASFSGAHFSLFRQQKMLLFLNPTRIAAPPAKEPTNHIANGVPFVVPAPMTFMISSFQRASIVTRVNAQGHIEVVPADTLRIDNDPDTLAPKGMVLEPSRTNIFINPDNLGGVGVGGVLFAPSIDFALFASGSGSLIIRGNDVPRTKFVVQNTTLASPND